MAVGWKKKLDKKNGVDIIQGKVGGGREAMEQWEKEIDNRGTIDWWINLAKRYKVRCKICSYYEEGEIKKFEVDVRPPERGDIKSG